MKKIAILSALIACLFIQATVAMSANRHHGHKHHAKHHKMHKAHRHGDPAYQN